MTIPPKYEDVVAKLEAERELHKLATETLGQFADENQKLHANLAALREELAKQVERSNDFASKLTGVQQRLTVAEQRNASITGKVSSCKDCGSSDLFWFAQNTVPNGIQQNRLNSHDIECVFFLGCNHCSATLKQVSADRIAEKITAALKPAAEGEGS